MEYQRIRVLLDLSKLKDRPHKYVWMHISTSDLKSIADFKDAVIKKLALDRNVKDIKMFINGGLLLEEENILVLRENDAVQIQCENISTDLITSYIEVQDSPISGVGLSSELSNDNLSKVVKRKKKRDLVSNNSSENHNSINLSQEESAMTFCEINEESVYNENKQKKSCSASTPKEDFIKNKQNSGKPKEKSAVTFWDIGENNMHELKKKKQTQYTYTSVVTDAPIQIEEDNDINVIYAESANIVSDSNKSVSQKKKRKSCSNSASSDALVKNQHCEDNGEISIIPVEISLDDSQETDQMEITNDQSIAVIEPLVQSNNCKKKKRRRHRKRRIVEQNLVGPFMLEDFCTLPQPPALEPFRSAVIDKPRQHIRFTSPELDSKKKAEVVNLEACNLKSESKISLVASLNESCISPETGRNNSTPVINVSSPNMNTASYHKTFYLNSSIVSSLKNNYLKELSLKNPVSTRTEFEPSRITGVHSFQEYPPLNALPCIGTCIAFKLLELNESYSPEISSYKEGVIKSINSNTDEIEIELTREEIKPGRSGKFENLKEGEFPVAEVTNNVKTCWSSLIEPRLVPEQ